MATTKEDLMNAAITQNFCFLFYGVWFDKKLVYLAYDDVKYTK